MCRWQRTHVEDNLPNDVLVWEIFIIEVHVSYVTQSEIWSSRDLQGKIYQDDLWPKNLKENRQAVPPEELRSGCHLRVSA